MEHFWLIIIPKKYSVLNISPPKKLTEEYLDQPNTLIFVLSFVQKS